MHCSFGVRRSTDQQSRRTSWRSWQGPSSTLPVEASNGAALYVMNLRQIGTVGGRCYYPGLGIDLSQQRQSCIVAALWRHAASLVRSRLVAGSAALRCHPLCSPRLLPPPPTRPAYPRGIATPRGPVPLRPTTSCSRPSRARLPQRTLVQGSAAFHASLTSPPRFAI